MLRLDQIDFDTLETALEFEADGYLSWWLDPATGEIILLTEDNADSEDETADDLDARGAIKVEPIGSRQGYSDMESFVENVSNERTQSRLYRALNGNRPFAHFKDALLDFPDVRELWFTFHDRAMRRHAIEWLVDVGAVDEAEVRKAPEE